VGPLDSTFTTDIITASQSGSISVVEQVVIASGISATQQDNMAYTAVVASIFHGFTSVTSVLMDRTQIHVDTQGKFGNSPLMWAAFFGQTAVVQNLLLLGADFALTNSEGDTALDLAERQGNRDIAALLLNSGATF